MPAEKLDDAQHSHSDPKGKNKERADVEIVTFARLRFLHVEVDVKHDSHDQKERQKDKPHLPYLF